MHLSNFLRYLRLPLQSAPLLLIVCFTLLLRLAELSGLTGLPLLLIISSWFFKYSFVMLDHIIDGRTEAPVLSMEMINPVEQRPFGLLLLIIVGYQLTVYLQAYIGHVGAVVIRSGMIVLVPAMVAAMSLTGRFVDGLNPVALVGLIARIPLAYGSLVIVIALLWLIPTQLLKLMDAQMVSSVVGLFVFMYVWLTMMASIGGIMYEHRDELGIEPAFTPERMYARAQAEIDRDRDRVMDLLFSQCRSGTFDKAMTTASTLIDDSAQPLDEFRWLYARAAGWPDQRLAARLLQQYLPRLIEARANSEALDKVRERLRVDNTFRPATAAQLIKIATLARDGGDKLIARRLLNDFEQHFPNDPATPMLAKLQAELTK